MTKDERVERVLAAAERCRLCTHLGQFSGECGVSGRWSHGPEIDPGIPHALYHHSVHLVALSTTATAVEQGRELRYGPACVDSVAHLLPCPSFRRALP